MGLVETTTATRSSTTPIRLPDCGELSGKKITTHDKEVTVTKVAIGLSIALTVALATQALARSHHHRQPTSGSVGSVDSGYGPPANWNEIEISIPSVGG
jgi:hypothetical protein